MGTYFKQKDLETLRELRATLLGMEQRPAGEPAQPYWASARTLELYDRIFAARIGWKWEAVLDEVEQRGGLPAPRSVLDWGTGTGGRLPHDAAAHRAGPGQWMPGQWMPGQWMPLQRRALQRRALQRRALQRRALQPRPLQQRQVQQGPRRSLSGSSSSTVMRRPGSSPRPPCGRSSQV